MSGVSQSERVSVPAVGLGRRRPSPRRRFRFESFASSHVGAVRDHNEDFAFSGQNLVAVADGVGGNVFGEVASALVIESLAYLEDLVYTESPEDEVTKAVRYANSRIAEAVQRDHTLEGMATTLTALRLDGASLMTMHVGDSRAYALRSGEFVQITRDDSLVRELLDAGAITAEQARRHPARSVVLQALNGGPFEPHVEAIEAADGDRYLLCSDGLSDYVDEQVIAHALAGTADREQCCRELTEAALAAGAPDNVTCVVADVRELRRT